MKTAQPKIQKMLEEEGDDPDAVVKLLELNDVINTTIERYNFVRKGDLDSARALPLTSGNLLESSSASAAPVPAAAELSLIDLEDGANGGPIAPVTGKTSIEDDLLGLSFQDNSSAFGQGGGIALGFGANTGEGKCSRLDWIALNCRKCQEYQDLRYYPQPLKQIRLVNSPI